MGLRPEMLARGAIVDRRDARYSRARKLLDGTKSGTESARATIANWIKK
jgi:hypothetical protein